MINHFPGYRRVLLQLLLCCTATLTAQAQERSPGDVNGDGLIDQADLIRGIDLALGRSPSPDSAEFAAADMDLDGRVTVRDLVLLSQTIGGGNRPPVADAGATPDTALANQSVQLDATASFDLDSNDLTFLWRQLEMPDVGTEYVTTNQVQLDDPSLEAPSFTPVWSGTYRFELSVTDQEGLVSRDTADVLVLDNSARRLSAKGIVFGDVFGQLGGPEFDLFPDHADSVEAVLGRAMDGAVRVGAGWVGIVPAAWYSRINPLPEIDAGPNSLGLTDEQDYGAIVAAAHAKGLRVVHREQLATGILPLRPGETDSLRVLMESSAAWWDQWFDEWKAYLLDRVEMAERHGVEMFDLFHFPEDTFRPTVYPAYEDRWRDIIAAVRQRYSGLVTINVINAGNLTFADALDVLHITVFDGLYTTRDVFADVENPSIEEVRAITEDILDAHLFETGGTIPVYYILTVHSSNGQVSGDPVPPPDEDLDNREQVLYYEGFLQALEDKPWVEGFFSERWAWFDQLDRPGIYNDQQVGTSPRNKPAEEFLRIWFGNH